VKDKHFIYLFETGHRTTVGAHVTMKSGGKGLMNVCYDRLDQKNKTKTKIVKKSRKLK
jgi:hypothetical protein